ncbi:hypothetical protein F4678DRAFT_167953 [Xylaria arbuscula]|nr:hypothetical protein F4678DRAFT_167953 [Xylaria arbuscula]
MGDAYLRTGRGGAGNFYSQKDVEDAAKRDRTEDIEAQKPPGQQDSTSTAPSPQPQTTTPGAYARSGRGGAGNFVTPSSSSSDQQQPPSPPVQQQPSSSAKHSGRGGAGNWADDGESEEARLAKAEQEQRRKEALDAGIVQEIRDSLPLPRRTYHLHEPGRGRRSDDDVVDA